MIYDDEILKRIAKSLGIRFPIAEFARKLEYSKGVVSEYYNGKKEVSENFKEQLENYYNIKFSDFEIKKQEPIEISDIELLLLVNERKERLSKSPLFKRIVTAVGLDDYIEDVKKEIDLMNNRKIQEQNN